MNEYAVGNIFDTNKNGKFKILEYISSRNILIEFINTGFKTSVTSSAIKRGYPVDKILPSVCGIGFLGDGPHSSKLEKGNSAPHPIYGIWRSMISRCYNEKDQHYKNYHDCNVDPVWHNYQIFATWFIMNMPDDYSGAKYHLDKDIKIPGNRIYSPDTCIFIESKTNLIYSHTRNLRQITLQAPTGEIVQIVNTSQFASKHNMSNRYVNRMICSLSQDFHGGWKILNVEQISPEQYIELSANLN